MDCVRCTSRVGASRATLYYYFAGRDDLLAFLLTEQTRR
jgi:AcrR family transcriptional regulator